MTSRRFLEGKEKEKLIFCVFLLLLQKPAGGKKGRVMKEAPGERRKGGRWTKSETKEGQRRDRKVSNKLCKIVVEKALVLLLGNGWDSPWLCFSLP